ncbi:MAG: TrpB-like pyridoxal phosphate-dependent enzyme [Actinobacteria bacterium]|nr:TrpB-like pyridoxal phosphate-dependent enzyme [Actinomycetota bacterium]
MALDEKEKKIVLSENDIPKQWYNVNPDLPKPLDPPFHPKISEPVGPYLAQLFPMELLKQETSMDRFIDIPKEILDIYRMWRPTPLVRADRLEKFLGTPARIYYKNESVSPAGSHKPNTAVAQAYFNKAEGTKRLTTETGAGQWGSALAFAGNLFGLDITIYMVKVSYNQKPYRKTMMRMWGAEVFASPTEKTESGRAILAQDPDSPGSLGIAISEAVEDALKSGGHTKYSLGSVLNHVILHQTIVGLETKKQFEKVGDYPDILVGCIGGGSNFAGFSFPFIPDKQKGQKIKIVAVEPDACPSVTKGPFAYDYGDTAKLGPIAKMYTLGHDFVPAGIHAGGLRYHGMAPQVSLLCNEKVIEAVAIPQTKAFEAGIIFTKTEGIIPAPETTHAIKIAIDEALKCKETGEKKVIAFNFSGHGHLDLGAFESYLDGKIVDYEYPEKKVKEALAKLPKVG